MDFRTKINIGKSSFQLQHFRPILLLGSCFSENIGNRLQFYKFDSIANPLSISYNPISINNSIFKDNSRWENKDGLFFSYDLHSDFNGLSKNECELHFEHAHEIQASYLKKADTIFITYGTAWVYELAATNQIVNNCHKQPISLFNKRLLNTDEIISSWKKTMSQLSKVYSKEFNFVFTVSPIRHLKNGFHENQLSKSTLLLAINDICNEFINCHYFPSYELVMDDLRDYRFYESNLTHPNSVAIEYIWDKLSDCFFSQETVKLNTQISKFQQALRHKPFHKKSSQHQTFLKKLHQELFSFQKETNIDFSQNIELMQEQLLSFKS